MAIRADSICRLVTYAGSRAWMAYSPKLIDVPPLALPERLGWCCLRCLTRRGMSIGSAPLLVGRGGLGAGDLGDGLLRSDLAGRGGHGALGRLDSGRLGCGRFGSGAAGLGAPG